MNDGPDAARASGAPVADVGALPFRPPPTVGLDQRFRSLERLRKRPEFQRVQNARAKATSQTVIVLRAPGVYPWTRLGVTVSRKVGNAVVRSGVKRRIREVFRTTKQQWADASDYVVIARPAAAGQSGARLRADVLACVARLAHRGGS